MTFFKITFSILLLLLSGVVISKYNTNKISEKKESNQVQYIANALVEKNTLKSRATVLKKYIKDNGYNTTHCFLVNMAIPSGKKRFFVYNLLKDSIENSGLVAHGSGSELKKGVFTFNNTPNSLASAKGKYKIGASYFGDFGLAYKLHGLDATNNKAYERFIVLHSHECVPAKEVYPSKICVSWGCPTVNPDFLKVLQSKIKANEKPILLDIQYMK
jgi:L,D-transpeptidase catalytic domain